KVRGSMSREVVMQQPKQLSLRMLYQPAHLVFATRTLSLMWFDLIRLRARLKRIGQRNVVPPSSRLHVGCGNRRIKGWLNIDVIHSDYDVDLACGRLPWRSGVFDAVISQHVIEHLELVEESLPLPRELHRVMKPNGELWLSCPDIEKVCRSYIEHGMLDLLQDRRRRDQHYSIADMPPQQLINDLFHQYGQHKNLYDFRLLEWALTTVGFTSVERKTESDLLARFPEFPARNDDQQSIYVCATVA
ncbi:MAG TPA: methyltransferase domain-containing protein, partial [Roseiflexaceae bacterium]|nr:methyltransferase domain-containing protein [Roseiflexaceae bacterium]